MINQRAQNAWRPKRKKRRLRFTPTAWAKLLFLRDHGDSEVGGFGVSSPVDLLLVEEIKLVKQRCTQVSVKFDDHDVADYFEEMVDRGMTPKRFARIWIHTHPGNCPLPSAVDEETFQGCFGGSDWAVMFILAQNGSAYGRLRFHAGPCGDVSLTSAVDFQTSFGPSDELAWEEEYATCVTIEPPIRLTTRPESSDLFDEGFFEFADHGYLENNPWREGP